MTDTTPDSLFETAKMITEAHGEGIKQVVAQCERTTDIVRKERDKAKDAVKSLTDQVIHMAQVVHQAYHTEKGQWTHCRMPSCFDAARLMRDLEVGHGIDMRVAAVRRERDEVLGWAEIMETVILSVAELPDLKEIESFQEVVRSIKEVRRG